MPELPTGTVTFLFTDIEGSTRLWEEYPDGMRTAVARHEEIIRTAIEAHGGYVFKTVGDAFCATFATAPDALEATLEFQLALSAETWGETGSINVRAALHTGAAEERDGDYYGPPVNRVARLLSAGHGGQVILSQPTYDLVRDNLPEGTSLNDMGEHRLKDLARPEQVFQVVSPDLPADFVPLKTLDTRPNNLPVQPTPFIGREKELDAGSRLLSREDVRLLTLTGPGGTGKTRLGMQIAADLIEDFEQGVFFVSLDPISNPDLVPSTIAHTLGLQESGDQPIFESLKNYLNEKEILLILDNFEQVISAAPFVSDLLAACPKLKVLVTSREVLHLSGEQSFPVPPLTLPERKVQDTAGEDFVATLTQYEAVRLFIERARSVKPDFEVTNENAPAVAEICHRLDGLPLAIELAIARIRLLTPQKMLERLEKNLPLLTKGARDLPERQQTLQGAIAWSHDLLEEYEKVLFRRISVFVNGCTLETVEEVCNVEGDLEIDVLDGIASLVDKSLIRQEEVKGEPRIVMLGTIREYGLEKLRESGEEKAIRQHHEIFFLALVERAEPELYGPEQVEWIDRLELEHDNLRAALEWSLRGDKAEEGLRLAGALGGFWATRGYYNEGYRWLEESLSGSNRVAASKRTKSARAKALSGAEDILYLKSDYKRSEALNEECLALYQDLEDKRGAAWALSNLGNLSWRQGDYVRARELHEKALSSFREVGDKHGIANSLYILGNHVSEQGDHERALSLSEETLDLFRELGSKGGIMRSLGQKGHVVLKQGDHEKAKELIEESLALSRELGNKRFMAYVLRLLGLVALGQEDPDLATQLLKESLVLYREMGIKHFIALCLEGFTGVAVAQGESERSARLLGAAEEIREAVGAPMEPSEQVEVDGYSAAVRAELDEKAFSAAWAEGRAMTVEEAIDYALKTEDT